MIQQKQKYLKPRIIETNVLDFDFNSDKDLLSLINRESLQLYSTKYTFGNNYSAQKSGKSIRKLLKDQKHDRKSAIYFRQKLSTPSQTLLKMFMHHAIFTTDNTLHIDRHHSSYRDQVSGLSVDEYGLIKINSGSSVYLCKYLTARSSMQARKIDQEAQQRVSPITNLSELRHQSHLLQNGQQSIITASYMKNSLLVSGTSQGIVSLWDINKSKQIFTSHRSQSFSQPVQHIDTFLNYQTLNTYFINYGNDSEDLMFCDIRTNKPIKVLSQFNGGLNCHMSKRNKGLLVGTGLENTIDIVDIASGFKCIRAKIKKEIIKNVDRGFLGEIKMSFPNGNGEYKQNQMPVIVKNRSQPNPNNPTMKRYYHEQSLPLNCSSSKDDDHIIHRGQHEYMSLGQKRKAASSKKYEKLHTSQMYEDEYYRIQANRKVNNINLESKLMSIQHNKHRNVIRNPVMRNTVKDGDRQQFSQISSSYLDQISERGINIKGSNEGEYLMIGKTNGAVELFDLNQVYNGCGEGGEIHNKRLKGPLKVKYKQSDTDNNRLQENIPILRIQQYRGKLYVLNAEGLFYEVALSS